METFPRYWPFVMGIHLSPVDSPQKDRWRGALMFSLISAWTNAKVNDRDDGDFETQSRSLWRHCYDLTCSHVLVTESSAIIDAYHATHITSSRQHIAVLASVALFHGTRMHVFTTLYSSRKCILPLVDIMMEQYRKSTSNPSNTRISRKLIIWPILLKFCSPRQNFRRIRQLKMMQWANEISWDLSLKYEPRQHAIIDRVWLNRSIHVWLQILIHHAHFTSGLPRPAFPI